MQFSKKLGKINLKDALSIWLDVSMKKIDVCVWGKEEEVFLQVKNEEKDLIRFSEELRKGWLEDSIPIVIESTGDLHLLASLVLSKYGFTVKEINPILTKHYISHTIRWTKTDKTDAKTLAKIWMIEGNQLPTFNRTEEVIGVSKKVSLIASLETQIQWLKASIKGYKKTANNLGLEIWENIKDLEKIVKNLESKAKDLQEEIENHKFISPEAEEVIERLDSIIWITKYTATVCYISFAHKSFKSKESMFAFIGYDPKLKQSWDKNIGIRISKRWNPYVRKRLFQSAFCSIQHCKLFKNIYQSMIARWKHHFMAVISRW